MRLIVPSLELHPTSEIIVFDLVQVMMLLCRYFVVGPAAQATHVAVWISKHLPSSVQLRDVTSQYTVLAVMGPHSRKLLKQVTSHPLDNDNFPFGKSQVVSVVYSI